MFAKITHPLFLSYVLFPISRSSRWTRVSGQAKIKKKPDYFFGGAIKHIRDRFRAYSVSGYLYERRISSKNKTHRGQSPGLVQQQTSQMAETDWFQPSTWIFNDWLPWKQHFLCWSKYIFNSRWLVHDSRQWIVICITR